MLMAQTGKRLLRNIIAPEQYDFWAQELGSISAWERCFARVISLRQESEDTISLTLKPNANFPAYQAGQHMNLSATIEGRRITRSYSFTSTPDQAGLISLTVRRDREGLMSNWLHSQAQVGGILEISGVFGEMTLEAIRPASDDNIVLLAAGSGITPLLSLIRQRMALGHSGKTTLLYWEHSPNHFCFNTELDALAQAHPNLAIHRLTTQTAMSGQSPAGRICAELLDSLLGAPSSPQQKNKTLALICGGAGFVQTAQLLMADRARQCHVESFSPLSTSPLSASPNMVKAETVSVTLRQSRRVLKISNQHTLLEALEAQGIAVESGCRMGICNTCSCGTAEGKTRDITTGQIHSGNATRLCISQAVSDLQLEL